MALLLVALMVCPVLKAAVALAWAGGRLQQERERVHTRGAVRDHMHTHTG